MTEQFVSEPIRPVADAFQAGFMAAGSPGMPREFIWRGRRYGIAKILRVWRTTGPCRHGSGEQYTRRHWFEVETSGGRMMKIYFDKGTRGRGWYLYTAHGRSRPCGRPARPRPAPARSWKKRAIR